MNKQTLKVGEYARAVFDHAQTGKVVKVDHNFITLKNGNHEFQVNNIAHKWIKDWKIKQ